MYYVTMTDKFLSGWGMAKDKTNKLVIECKNFEQAEAIERNALKRSEMKYVNICSKKPYYNSSRFHVSWKSFDELGDIWKR